MEEDYILDYRDLPHSGRRSRPERPQLLVESVGVDICPKCGTHKQKIRPKCVNCSMGVDPNVTRLEKKLRKDGK